MGTYRTWRTSGAAVWLAALFCFFATAASPSDGEADEYSFISLRLPHAISVDAPRHWRVLNDEANKLIATSRDAALDLSGLGIRYTGNVLFAANSLPASTYASMRVTYDPDQPFSKADLDEARTLTNEDLVPLAGEMAQMQQQVLAQSGLKILKVHGLFREDIGPSMAWSFRYQRSGPSGPVEVDLIQIFRPDGTVRVNLAYRQAEEMLWKVVIRRIKTSIRAN